jgi:monoterpene epsilon-lactone hydrolase
MTKHQRDTVDQMLRETWGDSTTAATGNTLLDLGGDVDEQRRLFAGMMTSFPLPPDVHTQADALGGVPVLTVTIDDITPTGTILYFHGGAYALGAADQSVRLASELARRTGTRVISVEYALAPEHRYPAAVDDAVTAYRALLGRRTAPDEVVFVGESSGGGLALAAALEVMAGGGPAPAAIYVASPWVDLTTSGTSMISKADVDPSVSAKGLRRRARDYAPEHVLTDARVSPVFADLTGLPPLLIQVGGNEVLLDDATRLAARAAADSVHVTLQVTPEVPHVFVGFVGMLDEADEALEDAAGFIRVNLGRPRPDREADPAA